MAPGKKTSTMFWVRESPQPENMVKPKTKKLKPLLLKELPSSSNTVRKSQQPKYMTKLETELMKTRQYCYSLLEDLPYGSISVSNSQHSPIPKLATKDHSLFKPDWSRLPEELLHIISDKLEDCFDVIHARSVCHSWRSIFPFPTSLLHESYSLPSFSKYVREFKGVHAPSCTLEKFPVFFFRIRAPPVNDGLLSVFFVGGINQDNSEGHMELQSPLQCSVKMNVPDSEPILLNVLDFQIFPLGYQFRMVGLDSISVRTSFKAVAFLPLDKEGGEEFVVLIGCSCDLLVLRSSKMKWMRLERISRASCSEIVAFRGKFYVNFLNHDVFVIDPYSLQSTPLMPLDLAPLMPSEDLGSVNSLVPSGNDELFLVEKIIVRNTEVLDLGNLVCRVCKLDEDAGEWVVVTELGDRVLLIGEPGNSSCSATELPDGCGVSGNSFLDTNIFLFGGKTSFCKYGVDTGNVEDNLNLWRQSRETVVTFRNTLPVVDFRYESSMP